MSSCPLYSFSFISILFLFQIYFSTSIENVHILFYFSLNSINTIFLRDLVNNNNTESLCRQHR